MDNVEILTEDDRNKLAVMRREKLGALREKGNAYPNTFRRTHWAKDCHAFDELDNEAFEAKPVQVSVAGRMMTQRVMGKASFATLVDSTGKIQLYIKGEHLPEGAYDEFKHWDLGDILGATGTLFKTKTGELSVQVTSVTLITKSLQPLPDKFHGLTDTETCCRQRYVDLMMNEDTRKTFKIRSQVVQGIRDYLLEQDFLEVETPMMVTLPSGALAKPFVTHHNALDMTLYLRIAPELYLKRLVVGGLERVFEINRNFRNEGISTRHNPEFTMVEFYQSYADYKTMMDHTEKMLKRLTTNILGTNLVPYGDVTFDFGTSFERLSVAKSVQKFNPSLSDADLNSVEKLTAYAKALGLEIKPSYGWGKILIEIFEATVEEKLIQPTFITEYPAEVSPLARCNDHNALITDRFEFFVGGREIANGYSELNDPDDQANRFKEQVQAKESGDAEAMMYDEDYINALEYGMPPTAGQGIGIDRLVMLFTNSHTIRDVILFPHMRPASGN